MSEVFFYHMTRTPLEATLPLLLTKSVAAGWRVLVRGTERAHMEWLDEKLWLGVNDSFLPHGLIGGAHDADQPVLLSHQGGNPHAADAILLVGGAEIDATEVAQITRASILFDGNDEAAVAAARVQWKTLTGAGISAQYWSQADGNWQKKAEA